VTKAPRRKHGNGVSPRESFGLRSEARHFADEAVSGAGDSLDVSPPVQSVAQRFAERRDMNGKNALFDERVGPDLREQFRFCNQPPGVTKERDQYVVCLGSK
jgi:hypothetical protein